MSNQKMFPKKKLTEPTQEFKYHKTRISHQVLVIGDNGERVVHSQYCNVKNAEKAKLYILEPEKLTLRNHSNNFFGVAEIRQRNDPTRCQFEKLFPYMYYNLEVTFMDNPDSESKFIKEYFFHDVNKEGAGSVDVLKEKLEHNKETLKVLHFANPHVLINMFMLNFVLQSIDPGYIFPFEEYVLFLQGAMNNPTSDTPDMAVVEDDPLAWKHPTDPNKLQIPMDSMARLSLASVSSYLYHDSQWVARNFFKRINFPIREVVIKEVIEDRFCFDAPPTREELSTMDENMTF